MATIKIWPVKGQLKQLLDYAGNPEKTTYEGLSEVIGYAADPNKTKRLCYVSGINCTPSLALNAMNLTKSSTTNMAAEWLITLTRALSRAK